MGVWGTGLYSGDFAMDLRTSIAAVARLPFEGDKLVELLSGIEPGAAHDPENEDHSTFWLIIADQFARRGIDCASARKKALQIIDGGSDLAMLARLGMKPAGLNQRRKMLADLRQFLTADSRPVRPRSVLKKPQPYLMEAGDLLVYPTSSGKCINPYFPSKERIKRPWIHDGWAATLIVEHGRAFDFLAWYRPLAVPGAFSEKPSLARLRSVTRWTLKRPGTCSRIHFKRMEFEKIGALSVDKIKLDASFPERPSARSAAVNDISIANGLNVAAEIGLRLQSPALQKARHNPTINSLDEILF